jgi:hypothetical protein
MLHVILRFKALLSDYLLFDRPLIVINKLFCLFLSNDKINLYSTGSSGNTVNVSISNIRKSGKCTTAEWLYYRLKRQK